MIWSEVWLWSGFAGILMTGLVAGTVFAYGNSVMPGLRKVDDQTFVVAVRVLNASVDNPVFLTISNGALIAQILALISTVFNGDQIGMVWSLIALVAYLLTLGITFLGNLPLNKAIIKADLPSGSDGWRALRTPFELRWTMLNHLRTLTCLLSVVASLTALIF